MTRAFGGLFGLLCCLPTGLVAQAAGADSTARPVAAPMTASAPVRASWMSDQRPLRVGDLITVVVDERANAAERMSKNAAGSRSQAATFSFGMAGGDPTGASFGAGMNNESRDRGDATRSSDLTTVLTVRVVAIEPGGLARIEGTKMVNVDNRPQEIRLSGIIRASDVSPSNVVTSTRIADAQVLYKGKNISPRSGIVGKLLGIFWP